MIFTLNCLFLGQASDRTISVIISEKTIVDNSGIEYKDITVSHVKYLILSKTGMSDYPPDELDLWKVDRVSVEKNDELLETFSTKVDIKDKLGGELMKPRLFLDQYFNENSFKDKESKSAIHIIVQLLNHTTGKRRAEDSGTNVAKKEKLMESDDSLKYVVEQIKDLKQGVSGLDQKIDQKVSGLDQKVSGLDQKVEQGFDRVNLSLKSSSFSPGTMVTGTEKGAFVMNQGREMSFPLELTKSSKTKGKGRFTDPPNKSPNSNPAENKIQKYFIDECEVLEKSQNINNKLTVVDTHFSPTLGTRKPDFLFIPNGTSKNMLNAVVVGEIKKRSGDNFNNASIGQAISFGEKVLQLQPRRKYVLVVLTDCVVINIYRVTRVDHDINSYPTTMFKYEYIKPEYIRTIDDNVGWKHLVTIMESSPKDLGWVGPSLKFGDKTVELVKSVGMGRTSIVYEGKYDGETVAVKMARTADYWPCFKREIEVLKNLADLNSPHIPKILLDNEDSFVMSQLGNKISNFQKKDVKDIVMTLKDVHSRGIIHRDLRKYNFLRVDSKILIVDWGYSVYDGEKDTSFAGALESMPDNVLELLIGEEDIHYELKIDLVCFVRSFYLMMHRPVLNRILFDAKDKIKTRAQTMLDFWKDLGRSELWSEIYDAIEEKDYEKLIQKIEMLF